MKASWVRTALKDNLSKSDFDQAAWKHGWLWYSDIPRAEDRPFESIRTTRSSKTIIHYFDDHLIDVRYIIIDDSGEEAQKVHQEICNSLDTYNYEDVERLLMNATNSEEYIRAIYRIAVAAPPQFQPHYFKLFEQVLNNPDAKVRDAGIFAIGYAGWPEFRNILEQIKATDTDATVRESAAIMLDGYERFKISKRNPIQPFSGIDKPKEKQTQNLKSHQVDLDELPSNEEHSQILENLPQKNIIFKHYDVKQEFIEFANNFGWLRKANREADPEEYLPLEITWVTPDQQTTIHYIEDWHIEDGVVCPFSLKTPYLIIEGNQLEKVAPEISLFFDTYSDDEIIHLVKTEVDTDELVDAIIYLSYAAPKSFNAKFFDALQKPLFHPDTWVRLAAVWASGSIGWLEFYKILEKLSVADPSEDVQQEASQMLEFIEIKNSKNI